MSTTPFPRGYLQYGFIRHSIVHSKPCDVCQGTMTGPPNQKRHPECKAAIADKLKAQKRKNYRRRKVGNGKQSIGGKQ